MVTYPGERLFLPGESMLCRMSDDAVQEERHSSGDNATERLVVDRLTTATVGSMRDESRGALSLIASALALAGTILSRPRKMAEYCAAWCGC